MTVDPIAGDQFGEPGAIDTARRAQVDIFHACVLPQGCESEAGGETFGAALCGFAINQQADASLDDSAVKLGDRRCSSRAWPCRSSRA
jgi:hypothetical protein